MNLEAQNSTELGGSERDRPRGPSAGRLVAGLVLSAGLGALAVLSGHRLANSAVVDLGPTDARYVRDFRDIERDGAVYFRWSSAPSSRVFLPVQACSPGSLRLRVRRHFTDPATLSVSFAGVVLGQRSIQARDDHPYDVIEFPFGVVTCDSKQEVLLESFSAGSRGLGVAVDWLDIRSPNGFRAPGATVLRGAAFLGLVAIALWLAGARLWLTLPSNFVIAAGMAVIFASDPVAAERLVRGGLVALLLTLAAVAAILRFVGSGKLSARTCTALTLVTLLTLLTRLAFLHTQAFYPDYRVHDLVQQALMRLGLPSFLDHLFEIQYARSLGLQQIEGRWYPFPYPPLGYALTNVTAHFFGLDALDASLVTAAAAASLIPAMTLLVGIALGLGETASLLGAFFVGFQPLLVRRMALGYFPAVIGQSVDVLGFLLLLAALRSPRGALRPYLGLAIALLAAFLTYTQSIANFGLLIAGLILLEFVRSSDPEGRSRVMRLALAGGIALAASGGAFYYRYLPVLKNLNAHRVQPESQILDRLDQARASNAGETPDPDDAPDAYTGPTFSPLRGLGRLVARLWIFNGPFVVPLVLGGWMLWRVSTRPTQNVLMAWGGVALWISLLAAGLPSPNGFQHLKDLEFTTPVAALAMAELTRRLWDWRPLAALSLAGSWAVFSAAAFAGELANRLLPLADF